MRDFLKTQKCELCGASFVSRLLDPHEISQVQRMEHVIAIGAICVGGRHRYLFILSRRAE